MKYVYKTRRVSKTTFKINCDNGFSIHTKIKGLSINTITLYDDNFISCYIEKGYLKKFKQLLEAYVLIEDDDGDDDFVRELDSLEYLILNEYKNYLPIEDIKNMLKDIYTLKQKILSKTIVCGKQR